MVVEWFLPSGVSEATLHFGGNSCLKVAISKGFAGSFLGIRPAGERHCAHRVSIVAVISAITLGMLRKTQQSRFRPVDSDSMSRSAPS
jgi:hypothetical protein